MIVFSWDSQPDGAPVPLRLAVLSAWLCALLSLSQGVQGLIDAIRAGYVAEVLGTSGAAGLPGVIAAALIPLYFGFGLSLLLWVVPPILAGIGVSRGYIWARYLMSIYAAASVATAAAAGILGFACAGLAILATVLVWLPVSRRYRPRAFAEQSSMVHSPREVVLIQSRSLRTAVVLLVATGVVGGHHYYLRRAWAGLLYSSLFVFAMLGLRVGTGWIILSALAVMVLVDAVRLRSLVDAANNS